MTSEADKMDTTDPVERLDLNLDKSLLDPKFEGYKVTMDNPKVEGKKFSVKGATVQRSPELFSLQHMKLFGESNLLFVNDFQTGENVHLYRFTSTGFIEEMIYNKPTENWSFSNVARFELPNAGAYPPSIIFTNDNFAVVCNGLDLITVFHIELVNDSWTKLLEHRPCEEKGISLVEARYVAGSLQVILHRVEERTKENKKTDLFRSKIYWLTIAVGENALSDRVTIERVREITQEGHYEACTLDNFGRLVILGTKTPFISSDDSGIITQSDAKTTKSSTPRRFWSQKDDDLTVMFTFDFPVNKEDVSVQLSSHSIFLTVKGEVLLDGTLGGTIDPTDFVDTVQGNQLLLRLRTTNKDNWVVLMEGDQQHVEQPNSETTKKAFAEMEKDELVVGAEQMEECDESELMLTFYWFDGDKQAVVKECDASCRQILFTSHSGNAPARICLRHDVDGVVWNFNDQTPYHEATLHAFGYVQASKTMRVWCGAAPNSSYACIVEANNHALLYWQRKAVGNELFNRKTSSQVTHISQQQVLHVRVDGDVHGEDAIIGVFAANDALFFLTPSEVLVARFQVD
ncbi:unnamed protein product [Caenorhabditis auriculariae]|uniref:NudC domain-containing protein 1 n=1 Tax=Caenorhabditis auriculariae TaxID=2777116 RepID=A0A8S1H6G6_9PELO|nr:unnamed protein product [Caenorhabditis auriculariae]